ncbi:MAG TPA: hypothetical protein VI408_14900 [Gaiellaceae bacterium]
MTAAAAVVLTVLLIAEGLTLVGGVGRFLTPHVFIGLLLVPPVLLKIGSTGWRMVSYYRGVEDYVRRGPPHPFLRLLVGPLLVVSTVVMFASGIGAAWVGHGGLLLGLHKASFVVWGWTLGIHFLAHLPKLPRAVRPDRRYVLVLAAVAVGVVVAFAGLPLAHHWHGFDFSAGDE